MNVGILGGTFNPIHRAHLLLGEAALRELELGRLLLVPARDPPLKSRELAAAHHRLAMLRAAVAERAEFEVCDVEMMREGPSYTVHTLEALAARYPGAALTFICGADAFAELESWYAYERLFELASFAVAQRPGSETDPGRLLPTRLAPEFVREDDTWRHRSGHSLRALPFEPIDVSATQIRARAARGEPIEDWVGAPVARYITDHQLYREAA